MALITISGYPCSGKTTRTSQLKEAFEAQLADPSYAGPIKKVIVISDHVLNLSRQAYDDGRKEKPQRAAVYAAMQRSLQKDTVTIVDGLNYIKGYRYQMYCAAREVGIRVATVFVIATAAQCHDWHSQRVPEETYASGTFENLIERFEEPSSMARWDSPLYATPAGEDLPIAEIWNSITTGVIKPPNAGTAPPPKPPSDALQTLETVSNLIISNVSTAQAAGSMPGTTVQVSTPEGEKLGLGLPNRVLTLSELQRLKRQFVAVHKKAITQGVTESGDVDWSEQAVARKFVEYLEERWGDK